MPPLAHNVARYCEGDGHMCDSSNSDPANSADAFDNTVHAHPPIG